MDYKKEQMKLREDASRMLQWYTFEAKEDEIDTRVMENLIALLASMDKQEETAESEKIQEAQEAYERFLQYKDSCEKEEALLHKTRGTPSKRKKLPRKIGWRITAAASVAIMVLALSGTSTDVRAWIDDGFFNWLEKDETGRTMITSMDTGSQKMEKVILYVYENVAEVPEKYRQYVLEGTELKSLKEFELQKIEIMETDTYVYQYSIFSVKGEDNPLKIEVGLYTKGATYIRENYSDYNYIESISEKGIEIDFYSEVEDSGDTKNMAFFYEGNVRYSVQGNYDLSFIEEVAQEYAKYVAK